MHYYKFHIGDFRRDTSHLSRNEVSIYRELLDWYYLDETPIPAETQTVIRRLKLGAKDKDDLNNVLSDFFKKTTKGWTNKRVDMEIKRWLQRGWFPSDPDVKKTRQGIDEWKETRLRIFKRDDYTCFHCGKEGGKLECDHLYPVSLGGTSEDDNLVASCKECNRDKSNKTLGQWLGKESL